MLHTSNVVTIHLLENKGLTSLSFDDIREFMKLKGLEKNPTDDLFLLLSSVSRFGKGNDEEATDPSKLALLLATGVVGKSVTCICTSFPLIFAILRNTSI